MGLKIQPKPIAPVAQQYTIFIDIIQHGDGNTVNIITQIPFHVLIGIGGLHGIDSSHQSSLLVGRIAVLYDVLENRAQLGVSTLLQPVGQSSAIEIAHRQTLMVQQHGYQFMDIICYYIFVWVNDKALISQIRRRDINLGALTKEPALHFIVSPTVLRVDGCQTLNNHLHSVRQLIDTWQTAFVLPTHHDTLVSAYGVLAHPIGHQCDA